MIDDQKHLFDIPPEVTYLNCAYMAPHLKTVTQAALRGLEREGHPWTIFAEDFFKDGEELRRLFANIIDAGAGDVALVPSVSYGLATAAANLSITAGSRLVLVAEQFPSNVYPWRRLARKERAEIVTVPRPASGSWTEAVLEEIRPGTSLTALPHCHWTDGAILDLERIGRRCRKVGAALVIDATQSLGAVPLSVKKIQPDFLVAAAYKWLLGPYGMAYLYVHPARQQGEPLEDNWLNRRDSEDFAGLVNYRDEFQAGSRRYDVGERSNFVLMPMAIAALRQISLWSVPQIAETLAAKTAWLAEQALQQGLTVADPGERGPHMIGLRFPGGVPPELVSRLREERIFVSVRGNSIRIAPHLYNDDADLQRFVAILYSAVKRPA